MKLRFNLGFMYIYLNAEFMSSFDVYGKFTGFFRYYFEGT